MARNVTNGVGRIGSKLGGGGGSGTITMTNPYTRATGLSTDANNNVTSVTLGEHKYQGIMYNSVGLITAYNEIIDDNEKGFSLTYNASNLVTNINEVTPWVYYNVSPASSSVDEGATVAINVTTNGTDGTFYWDTDSDDDITTNSGSFSISGGTGSFNITTEADTTTEGAETLAIRIYSGSVGGTLIGTGSVTINDTSVGAAGNQEYAVPGSYTWTIPSGVTQARVVVIGGGGAGGQYGGGGGGGASLKFYNNLTPGQTVSVTVGAGGQRSSNATGNDGTASSFAGPGQTISGGGGNGGHGNSQGSSSNYVAGGSGTGGAINGNGGGGYPYHSSGWGLANDKGPQADGTDGAGGGGGGGNDNGTGMRGGDGSYYAGGGGGGGADNGAGGIGGDGGASVIPTYASNSQAFGGGGGGTDGNNASGGAGGSVDGEVGQGQNTGTNNNNTGGDGGGPSNNRGEKGVGNGQNAGGGGGGAFGGGGGGAGHSDPNGVAGAGGGGLVFINWGPGVTEAY